MLMKDNKKGMAAAILARMPKKEGEVEETEPVEVSEDGAEMDDSVATNTAAEELISAIESKSAPAVVEAMKALMELCASEPDGDEASEQP